MKKVFNILMIFMVVSFVFMPTSSAWTWKTHSDIADSIYYKMPHNVQKKLSLSAMRDGSNDPDEKFHDFRSHSYPYSYTRATNWLNKGKYYYRTGKYKQASYCFGVASHYISDTFSAPHCVSGESSSAHTKYENQAKSLKPVITYRSGSLNTLMKNGYSQGKTSWKNWSKKKNRAYVQYNLNNGASASYTAIRSCVY